MGVTADFNSAFADRLTQLLTTPEQAWSIDEDGVLVGPGSMAIKLTNPDDSPFHTDVELYLNVNRPDAPVIHDCVAGFGDTAEAAAGIASVIFHESTWATFREWQTQRGEFADHYDGGQLGAAGWHEIVSGIISYGVTTASYGDLERWLLDGSPMAGMSSVIASELESGRVHGIKLVVGGFGDNRTAEIRIDGVPSAAASVMLRDLDWKTPTEFAIARCYGLFLPTEPPVSEMVSGEPTRSGRRWLGWGAAGT